MREEKNTCERICQNLLRFRYRPREFYEKNAELKQVLDQIRDGFFSPENPDLFHDIVDSLLNEHGDQYV